jgi:hypothetical protein
MKTKLLEIRDEGTFLPVLCVDMNPGIESGALLAYEAQHYLLRRVGYPCDGRPNIALTRLDANGGKCWNDPYGWGGRTYPVAHNYIIEHWAELRDGDVVDVSFILGETAEPKQSERVTVPL